MSNHSAIRGTEWPSGRGRHPVMGMGRSPCGSGSPSPGYLGRTVRSANWGVGMTTFFARSARSRANERSAIRSSLLRASSTTVCDVDRARYSLVAFSQPAARLGLTVVSPFFTLLPRRFCQVPWTLHFIVYRHVTVKINSAILVCFIKLSRCKEIVIVSDCVRAFKLSVRR
jgi:hypothetical protein